MRRARQLGGVGSEPEWSPPLVGSLFMANTLVFNNGDHADVRPVVVVRAPRRPMAYVTFIQRTSTCFHLRGFDHPADPTLGLDRDGRWVFDFQRSIRADEFSSHRFDNRGQLETGYLTALLEAWEAQP